jgi:hypothetical protein
MESKSCRPEFRETERAARTLGIPLQSLEIREAHDFAGAFQSATREHAGALIVVGSRIIAQHRQRIGDFAAQNRLILTGTPQWVPEIGGLLSYGPNAPELHRRAAYFVDKILKGAKPKDLPTADRLRADDQSQDGQGARARCSADIARPRRSRDRVNRRMAAAGPSRRFVATHRFGRYWRHSGHSVKPYCPSERRE